MSIFLLLRLDELFNKGWTEVISMGIMYYTTTSLDVTAQLVATFNEHLVKCSYHLSSSQS